MRRARCARQRLAVGDACHRLAVSCAETPGLRTKRAHDEIGDSRGEPVEVAAGCGSPPLLRRMKLFRPILWYDGPIIRLPDKYIAHLLTELGRLGLKVSDIERHDPPPHTETVLSDLTSWMSTHLGDASSRLMDWTRLDLELMRSRRQEHPDAKPRIEPSADITVPCAPGGGTRLGELHQAT